MTREDIYNYITTMCGGNSISVEFTTESLGAGKPSDLDVVIKKATEVYNRYRPKIHEFAFTVVQNIQQYTIPREQIGRGVFRYTPKQAIGDTFKIFPSTYYPINDPRYNIRSDDFMVWKGINATERKIFGTWDDFKYNPDSNTLTVYPIPQQSFNGTLETLHDRLFTKTLLFKTAGNIQTTYTARIKNQFNIPILNMVPGNCSLRIGPYELMDDYNGNFSSASTEVTGTIDYKTGTVTIVFAQAPSPNLEAYLSLCEIRTEDYDWFNDYCLAIARIIIGSKRKRFGGKIPGAQTPIDLDVEIQQQGEDAKKDLEDRARNWMNAWAIPRIQ